jgi:hypothetical protein
MIVLVDEEYHVSALIYWYLSHSRPFGVGFGRIHTLAGAYSEGEVYVRWVRDHKTRILKRINRRNAEERQEQARESN